MTFVKTLFSCLSYNRCSANKRTFTYSYNLWHIAFGSSKLHNLVPYHLSRTLEKNFFNLSTFSTFNLIFSLSTHLYYSILNKDKNSFFPTLFSWCQVTLFKACQWVVTAIELITKFTFTLKCVFSFS